MNEIKNHLYQDIPSAEIYQQINQILKTSSEPHVFSRYQLKQAIMQLGPSGYPFEKFIAALLQGLGYSVETGVIVSGKCINHEIDVVALKDNQHFMVECKFHNRSGTRSDVKVALYVKARFDDVASVFRQAWLITNTKLTSDAIQYGECAGMKMIGWSYPNKGSLQDLITDTHLHPITYLSSLSQSQKQQFLDNGIVLCKFLHQKNSEFFRSLNISADKEKEIRQEIYCIARQTTNRLTRKKR